MNFPKAELATVLTKFNPWWKSEKIADLPEWRRAIFDELFNWVYTPPAPRAVLLSGARQVGKTTLLFQVVNKLLHEGVPASNILYATFDHPIIKLAGIDAVIEAWRTREPRESGPEYLFLDEAQFIRDWGTWVKHQVDFDKDRRITFTGSVMPLTQKDQESGVGRWRTIQLPTLSFYEYLHLKKADFFYPTHESGSSYNYKNLETFLNKKIKFDSTIKLLKSDSSSSSKYVKLNYDDFLKNFIFEPKSLYDNLSAEHKLPQLKSFRELFDWPNEKFSKTIEISKNYEAHFQQYLVRGGFPQTTKIRRINEAQRLLREDIIDKALKRDMTAIFGVRRVIDLEQTFLYLCMHDGGLLEMKNLCENLEVKRQTAQHFIELLVAANLIYRLQPFGYGKDILRAKYKIYLADPAIAPAVLLKGDSIIDNPTALGVATETAVFKHLLSLTRSSSENVRLTYWIGKNKHEVDLIAEVNNQIIPFEVKYRAQHTGARELKGLQELCKEKSIQHGYVVTKSMSDFGPMTLPGIATRIMRIPAPLLCFWMGEMEHLLQPDNATDSSQSHTEVI